jgi:hypothetical protein
MANPLYRRRAAAVLFSLAMACLLAFAGLLAGMYLYGHFGPPAQDYDETDDYLCGLLVGAIFAVAGGGVLLWKLWPRSSPKVTGASASS